MGINGAHAYTHSISGVSIGELYQISLARRKENNQSDHGNGGDIKPTIDIDASWVYRNTHIAIEGRLTWMMNLGLEFAKVGFIVVFICDGDIRHHSKRATVERKSKHQRKVLDGYLKRTELMKLSKKRQEATSVEEINIISKQEDTLSTKIKNMNNALQATNVNVGAEFFEDIQRFIEDRQLKKVTYFDNISVVKALFQADSALAYRCVYGKSDIVLSSDSDLAALAGSRCLGIKSFKFNDKLKNDKLSVIIIYTPSTKTLLNVSESIHLSTTSSRIKKASFPFFDEVDDIKLRGLLAVGLGCDVYLSGLVQLGRTTLKKYLEKDSTLSYESLLKIYYDHYTKTYNRRKDKRINDTNQIVSRETFDDAMCIYVDTFIYEPTNYFSNDDIVHEKALYINNDIPSKLHEYIEAFANENPDILIYKSNNKLMECIGSGAGAHIFLDYEPYNRCSTCQNIICKYCCMNNEEDNNFCFDCYLTEVAVIPANVIDQPSLTTMRSKLLEIGVETANDDNVSDITDLFEALVEHSEDYVMNNDIYLNDVELPLHSSLYLDSEKIITRFDLRNGGCFIREEELTLNNKLDIIFLLAKLVESNNIKNKRDDGKLYSILPDIVLDFAERSRVHSGHRLLKRAVRHAMDPQGCSIVASNCCIIGYKETTGIHICHTVKASMRNMSYETRVSFTSFDIISVTCSCKAGSCGNEKVICVHILPIIVQLSLLLFDGLAEHILCELSNDFQQDIESVLSSDDVKKLKNAIIILKRANSDIEKDNVVENSTINLLLSPYKVGTESFKKGPGPPANIDKLGPLRNLVLISPIMKAKKIMDSNKQTIIDISSEENVEIDTIENNSNNSIEPNINDNNDTQNYIPYKKIDALNMFVKHYFKKDSLKQQTFEECVGYKLLKYRADKQPDESKKEMNALVKKLKQAFNDASDEYRKEKQYLSVGEKVNNDKNDSVEDKEDENYFSNNQEENVCKIIDNNNTHINNVFKKNYRRTCCANGCGATSTNSPTLKFFYVPKVAKKKNLDNITDYMLQTYHKNKFIRKEWMHRLNLPANKSNNYLRICDQHGLELQETEYTWINKLNQEIRTAAMIRMPRKKTDPPLKTRQQHHKRVSIDSINQPNGKRAKIIENIVIPTTEQITTTDTINETINETNNEIINDGKKFISRYCSYAGCCVNNKINTNKWYCIPKHPPPYKEHAKNSQRLQHAKKMEYRRLFLKSIGLDRNESRKDLRICSEHGTHTVIIMLAWNDKNNVKQTTKLSLDLPLHPSTKKQKEDYTRESKGLGIDRYLCKQINNCKNNIKVNDSLTWALSAQQQYALDDGVDNVHPSVAKAIGIDVHDNKIMNYKINNTSKEKRKQINTVRLDIISNKTIKQQTGFESKAAIITFIIIICNGNIELMTKKKDTLTWFEQWYFFLERSYGRSISRWVDFTDKYDRSESFLRILYDEKLKTALTCRQQWPKYATVEEDAFLRNDYWNRTYAGKRVVMWDNTCIFLPKPQDPSAQRNTYSAYYAGNVGKGAIFIQLCGWMGTHDLWDGAVTDSEYFTKSGLLQQQTDLIKEYDSENTNIRWINILDKGYRVTSAAWRSGQQFVLQPSFARSDKKFSTLETLRSAAVAHDRGANERAVRLSKMSGQLKQGIIGNKSIERLSDLWLTWSFECNFIYKQVL